MKKRIISLLLAAAMLVTLMPAAFAAGTYSDTDGHWGEAAIDRWSSYGVIGGYDGNVFVPDGSMTRAEVARVFVNLLGLKQRTDISKYKDVAPSAWYYDDIAKCVAAGILNGDGVAAMNPETPVTREELFTMFARALGVAPKATANKQFIDGNEVSSWAAGYVNALADMGVINGYGGVLSPGSDINRASVMTVLDNAIKTYVTTSGATVGAGDGIVLVVADNVTVTGKVENLVVADSGKTVTVNGGAVDSVTVVGPQDKVIFTGTAAADTVTIPATAEGASVVVNSAAAVGSVVSEADNVTISGAGKVETAAVSGDNTTVNTDGTDLTVAPGTTGVTENSKPVTGGTTVETEPVKNTTPSTPVTPPVYYPTYYTVNFQYTDGTEISTISAVAGSAVTAPEVTLTEGQQVKWHNGTDYVELSNLTVNGNMTLTAVVGSNSFTAGNGTEAYPYQIANATQLSSIIPGEDEDILYYQLTDNIDLKDSGTSGANLLKNVYFDGNGKTIFSSENKNLFGVFKYARGSVTLRNFTYDLTNLINAEYASDCVGIIGEAGCTYLLMENIKVQGSHTVDGNNGAFIFNEFMPDESTLIFRNCEFAADLQGNGYNACFIGWQGENFTSNTGLIPCKAKITFENCSVTGSLVCNRAAVFVANGSNAYKRTYTFSGNTISGTVRGTQEAKYFTAVSMKDTGVEESAKSSFNENANVYVGATDATLAISASGDTLSITASDNTAVTSYVVEVGIYTNLWKDGTRIGTWLYFVTETLDATGTLDVTLKNTGFVDKAYCETNNIDVTTDNLGNSIAVIEGKTYYVVSDYIDSQGDQGFVGNPDPTYRAAQVVRVSAYVGDTMYSSASLKK